MNLKDNWVLWVVAGAVIFFWVRQKIPAGLTAAYPDAYYAPPAGGTAVPGTAPVASASLALPAPYTAPVVVLPPGAVTGPTYAARSGRGHF
jgi:hypothetical protein